MDFLAIETNLGTEKFLFKIFSFRTMFDDDDDDDDVNRIND